MLAWDISLCLVTLANLLPPPSLAAMTPPPSLAVIGSEIGAFMQPGAGVVAPQPHLAAYRHAWKIFVSGAGEVRNPTSDMCDFGVTPDLWGWRMCLLRDGEVWCVQSPKDLQGLVAIPSADKAEEYLRAFSNVFTIRLFAQYHYVAVVDVNELTSVFAGARLAELNSHSGLAITGKTRREGDTYVCDRYLLEYRNVGQPAMLHAVVERLGEDGRYDMVVLSSSSFSKVARLVTRPSAALPR